MLVYSVQGHYINLRIKIIYQLLTSMLKCSQVLFIAYCVGSCRLFSLALAASLRKIAAQVLPDRSKPAFCRWCWWRLWMAAGILLQAVYETVQKCHCLGFEINIDM